MPSLNDLTFGSEGMANKRLLAVAIGVTSGIGILGFLADYNNKSVSSSGQTRMLPQTNDAEQEALLKNAEIIGDYLSHGFGGTTFRLPDGNVLKIVSLEKTLPPPYNQLNTNQADFFEAINNGDMTFSEEMVDIKRFGKGRAWVKMVQLVNSESKSPKHHLSVGEKVAYWVMEYVPTIGRGEMTDAKIQGGENRLQEWGKKNGWALQDFKDSNYGERRDGSYVMFDPWVELLESR